MKAIINKHLYDTETATLLGICDNSCDEDEEDYYAERLYQKRNGEYFIWVHGDLINYTFWENVSEWQYFRTDNIFKITLDQAQQWAERYMSAEKYMKFFEIEED